MSMFYGLNQAALDAFGEPVKFMTQGGLVTIDCIVERPGAPLSRRLSDAAALNGTVFGPDDVVVTMRSDAVTAACIAVRDTATIDGNDYTINGIWPDSAGMTALELRA